MPKENREQGIENLFEEIRTEDLPNLVKEEHKSGKHRVLNKMTPKRPTPRHVIIKMAKVRDRENLKSSKTETVTYKGGSIRLSADFSIETFQASRDWCGIFKMMKSKDLQSRPLCPTRLSFKTEGEIKTSQRRKSQRSSSSTNQYYKKC